MAKRKKQLIAEGKLDKYGRPNSSTPADWRSAYPDLAGAAAAASTAVDAAQEASAAANTAVVSAVVVMFCCRVSFSSVEGSCEGQGSC